MELIVRVSEVMSSLPRSGIRRDRSVAEMSRAVSSRVCSGASNRPDWRAAIPVINSSERKATTL